MTRLSSFLHFLEHSIEAMESDDIGLKKSGRLSSLFFDFLDLPHNLIYDEIAETTSTVLIRKVAERIDRIVALDERIRIRPHTLDNAEWWGDITLEDIILEQLPEINRFLDNNKKFVPYSDEFMACEENGVSAEVEYIAKMHEFKDQIHKKLSILTHNLNFYMNEKKIAERVLSESMQYEDFLLALRDFKKSIQYRIDELAIPECFFDNTLMLEAASEIFEKLNLIENFDKDKFKWEFGHRTQLTLNLQSGKKKYLTRAIYLLSDFVKEDFKMEWEKSLIDHFDLKGYYKNRNKFYDGQDMEIMEKTFERYRNFIELG